MSESQKDSNKKSKSAKAGNPVMDWIIRGVVFGVLGILLVLALLDYQAKQNATKTAEAWRAAMRSKGETSDLYKTDFSKIPVSGNPVVTSFTAAVKSARANTIDTYTWKGTFRTYTVKVSFGLGKDPSVEDVDGPGEAAQQ